MSVFETLFVYGGPTIGIILLVVLAVVAPKRARAQQRHRVGQAWDYQPLWWTANPEGADLPAAAAPSGVGERGGARGSW